MNRCWIYLAALVAALGAASPSRAAANLEIAPVVIDVAAPGQTGSISLKNADARPTSIQVRLFKWRQQGGQESYEATDEVVASPPIATVAPGETLTVRVIRSLRSPPAAEESYRLVLDQLPETDNRGHAHVSMLLRQVLPVFFANPDRAPPKVSWSVARLAKGWMLKAHNDGDERLRVAEVTLSGAGQSSVKLGGGLLGYVLGHADMSWTIGTKSNFRPGATLTVRGESDHGTFNAPAEVAAK